MHDQSTAPGQTRAEGLMGRRGGPKRSGPKSSSSLTTLLATAPLHSCLPPRTPSTLPVREASYPFRLHLSLELASFCSNTSQLSEGGTEVGVGYRPKLEGYHYWRETLKSPKHVLGPMVCYSVSRIGVEFRRSHSRRPLPSSKAWVPSSENFPITTSTLVSKMTDKRSFLQIDGSEATFRVLTRRHGVDLTYSPMMYSYAT